MPDYGDYCDIYPEFYSEERVIALRIKQLHSAKAVA